MQWCVKLVSDILFVAPTTQIMSVTDYYNNTNYLQSVKCLIKQLSDIQSNTDPPLDLTFQLYNTKRVALLCVSVMTNWSPIAHWILCCGLPAVWHSVSVVLYCSLVKKQSVSALQLSEPAGWSFEFPVVWAGSSGPPSQPAVWHSGKNPHIM